MIFNQVLSRRKSGLMPQLSLSILNEEENVFSPAFQMRLSTDLVYFSGLSMTPSHRLGLIQAAVPSLPEIDKQ